MDRHTDPRGAGVTPYLRRVLRVDALRRARAVEVEVTTLLERVQRDRPRTGEEIRRYGAEIQALAIRVQLAAQELDAATPRPWWLRWVMG